MVRSGLVGSGTVWPGKAWLGEVRHGYSIHKEATMPRKRMPRELWTLRRRVVWLRDGGRCQSPPGPHKTFCTGKEYIPFNVCHIDHIRSGKLGSNATDNLRVLCPQCH